MDQEKKEYTLDDLEDIIREYSSKPSASKPPREESRRLGDTRPLGKPTSSDAALHDTKPLSDPDEDVRVYTPSRSKEKKSAAPYTTNWEPEYDRPMGEYVPQEPIIFPTKKHPKKLEETAQQQYEQLNDSTLSQLRAGILLHLILFFAAAGTAFLYHQVDGQKMKFMILGQVLVLLLSALVGYKRLLDGVTDMFHRKFRLNSLLVVTLVVCWIDGLLCLKSLRLPFTAIFSLQMLMAQCAQYQRLQTKLSQLDTLRKASDLSAVVKYSNYYKNQPAYQAVQRQPQNWNLDMEDSGPEKRLCFYGLTVVALGALLALATALLYGAAEGVRVYAATLLAALPATAFICFQRPLSTLEKRMHKLGTVLLGWKGVQHIEKQGYYPLSHQDLFPSNHVKLNGVRFYGERNPNTVVSYVSALMKADGGSLSGPFEQLRSSRNARICKVEDLTSYPGGVGGQIDGLSVIAGTLEFIENMGVELSEVSRIPHAVYAAVNQSLCAVVAVNFSRSKSSAAGLRTLCDSSHVRPILVDCDFAMTGYFLEQKLGVDTRRMQFPDCMTRMTLAEKKLPEEPPVIGLATRTGLAQRAFVVTGGAALRSAWRYGAAVHILGGGIGFLAVTLLALSKAVALLTPYNLLLYGFVWMIPGLLVADWTRNV